MASCKKLTHVCYPFTINGVINKKLHFEMTKGRHTDCKGYFCVHIFMQDLCNGIHNLRIIVGVFVTLL